MSLFSVNAVIILASDDGSRILAKYYTPPHQTAPAGASHAGKRTPHAEQKAGPRS